MTGKKSYLYSCVVSIHVFYIRPLSNKTMWHPHTSGASSANVPAPHAAQSRHTRIISHLLPSWVYAPTSSWSRTIARYRVRALPLLKRKCSHASRAYIALFTRHRHVTLASLQSSPYHSASCYHHISELTMCLHAPESLRAFRYSTVLSHPYSALCLRLSHA
jgi:hypothetical protein